MPTIYWGKVYLSQQPVHKLHDCSINGTSAIIAQSEKPCNLCQGIFSYENFLMSACSITLWMHADDAMKPLKRMSV